MVKLFGGCWKRRPTGTGSMPWGWRICSVGRGGSQGDDIPFLSTLEVSLVPVFSKNRYCNLMDFDFCLLQGPSVPQVLLWRAPHRSQPQSMKLKVFVMEFTIHHPFDPDSLHPKLRRVIKLKQTGQQSHGNPSKVPCLIVIIVVIDVEGLSSSWHDSDWLGTWNEM